MLSNGGEGDDLTRSRRKFQQSIVIKIGKASIAHLANHRIIIKIRIGDVVLSKTLEITSKCDAAKHCHFGRNNSRNFDDWKPLEAFHLLSGSSSTRTKNYVQSTASRLHWIASMPSRTVRAYILPSWYQTQFTYDAQLFNSGQNSNTIKGKIHNWLIFRRIKSFFIKKLSFF